MEKEIWAGVMNDPMIAVSLRPPMSWRTQTQTTIAEKHVTSIPLSTSDPEGRTPPQDMALVPRRQPPTLPGFFHQVSDDLILPDIEGAYLPRVLALFDLSTLESLEMTVSHAPAMGEVHYHLKAQSQATITLLDTSALRYLGPTPRDEDWAKYLFQVWTQVDICYPTEVNFLSSKCLLTWDDEPLNQRKLFKSDC